MGSGYQEAIKERKMFEGSNFCFRYDNSRPFTKSEQLHLFPRKKPNPPTPSLMEELRSRQMVFSAVAVNNRLSSLKPVNSSSIEASRISPKPLDAKQSVSGRVPCFPSPGCSLSRWFTWRGDVTLSPLHSSQAFLEQGGKEDYRCSLGELPGFTSTTQKALRSQISGVAGGRALGVFWCPHSPTKGCTPLILLWLWPAGWSLPWFAFLAVFGQVKSKAKKLSRSDKQEKKKNCCHGVCSSHWGAQEPHSKASMESLPWCTVPYPKSHLRRVKI